MKKYNGRKNHQKSTYKNHQKSTNAHSQKEMNNTQKALWFSGIFSAVLTAVLIASINDARQKLHSAVMDNVRQDSEIQHNANAIDDMSLRLKELLEVAIGTNNAVIRVETKMNSFELAE